MSETELNKLKKKRTSMRTVTTKLITKVEGILNNNESKVEDFEELLEQLLDKVDHLKQLNFDIENLLKVDEIETDIEASQEYHEKVLTWKCRLSKRIKQLNSKQVDTSLNRAAHDSEIYENKSEVKPVKLPKLTINKFYGDPSNWLEFYDQFKSAIHSNCTLSKVDKFSYLKSLLGGIAYNAISGFALTNENYEAAINLLKERFGRTDVLINAHMGHLLNIPALKYSSDILGLRKLYDKAEVQIRSLESLGIVSETYGSLLCPLLLRTIPSDLALEFSRNNDGSKNWDLDQLLKFLRKEIESRERANSIHKLETKNHPETKYYPINAREKSQRELNETSNNRYSSRPCRINPPSAAEFLSTVKGKTCLFCNSENHESEVCKSLSVVDKRELLRRQARCFLCFQKYHMVRSCLSKARCGKCTRKHATSLCEIFGTSKQSDSVPKSEAVVTTSILPNEQFNEGIYLQTATANIVGGTFNRNVRCLLDLGSQRSFVLESVSKQLHLEVIGEEDVSIYSFGCDKPVIEKRKRVKLVLRNPRNFNRSIVIEALETPNISNALIRVPGKGIRNYCTKNNLQLADRSWNSKHLQLSILIGSDVYWKVVSGKIRRLSTSLVTAETMFGWTINGSSTYSDANNNQSAINVMKTALSTMKIDSDSETCTILRKFWELDSLGIINEQENCENERAILDQFHKSVKFEKNRYEVKLPWNERAEELNDNYTVALSRLKGLTQKFKKNAKFQERYRNVIEDYIERGIAEEASRETNDKAYYMPHQGVVREDKNTKLRVVFDASSHAHDSVSLNDCLISGPNLNPDLLGILIKFRLHKIAFIADIEQAFLQILLAPEDRNAVRFLWINGSTEENKELKLTNLRMTRVIFGATSSPFLLAATLKFHINKFKLDHPKAFDLLNSCLYVDDLISGTEEENEALEMYSDVKSILKLASFNMRNWKTNCSSLQQTLNDYENTESESSSDLNKVLGYIWNSKEDYLQVNLEQVINQINLEDQEITKRRVLQIAGRIYDPIGFLTPFTVLVRILMQDIWQAGLDWDTPLPFELQNRWKSWCRELPQLEELKIPRHYFGSFSKDQFERIELHCFSDASQKAYGTVIYFRYIMNGEFKSQFIISKTRVSPLKRLSLPRLELMAAAIGVRLTKYVQNQFSNKISLTLHFWTDSTVVLHWIKGNAMKWKPFVKNRVIEIQENSDPATWAYCRGEENPADMLTRGVKAEILENNEVWWHGPKWLIEDELNWHKLNNLDVKFEDIEKETRKSKTILQTSCIAEVPKENLFDLKKYSNLNKVHRITAWCLRFIANTKNKNGKLSKILTSEELENAEIFWIKITQESYFPYEMISLKNGKPIAMDSKIREFNPFLDENGIIRVGGRLQNANLNFSQSHPVLLPEKSYLTDLYIKYNHEIVGHGGIAETLTQLREKFWILKRRQRVKTIIYKCNVCQKFRSKPMVQDIAPLPPDRIKEAFPFQITGVDYAGPVYVKNRSESTKAYILLFTCAVTRAVHLELTPDLTAETFLLTFKRFIARRGICKVIYSDNAKTFKKAKKEIDLLYKCLNEENLQNYFGKQGIKWKFIVEKAAWWGGFWERLIRSVKSCLKKILGRSSLTFEELVTTLAEVEAILNSRPLTFVYSDQGEPEPLTPGHFLIGRRLLSLPQGTFEPSSSKQTLCRRLQHQKILIERIWRKWRTVYLMELRSAHHSPQVKNPVNIKEGDVVLVHEDKIPRLMWKMGTVHEIHYGRDGKIRSCTIRLSNGKFIKRPVQLLHHLELKD